MTTTGIPPLFFSGLITSSGLTDTSAGQLRASVEALALRLDAAGATLDDVVQITSFHLDPWTVEEDLRAVADLFGSAPPAWTPVCVPGTEVPGAAVGLRAVAAVGAGKESIVLDSQRWLEGLPIASGCRSGSLVFVSGQTAAGPDGHLNGSREHVAQARAAYGAIGEVLAAFSSSFDDALDFTHYFVDIRGGDPTFKEVYVPEVIGDVGVDLAATTTHVGASALLRPGLIGVYQAIADLTPGRRHGSTPEAVWWRDAYPLAAATRKPGSPFVSMAGHVAATGTGDIAHRGDPIGQLGFVLDGMAETLAGYGLGFEHIREIEVYAKDHREAPAMREVLEARLVDLPPTSIIGTTGLWLEGFEIEVSAIAVE